MVQYFVSDEEKLTPNDIPELAFGSDFSNIASTMKFRE